MRATLQLPEGLLEEAQQAVGAKTKTTTVIISLQELINKKKREGLQALRGNIDLDIDLSKLREDRF